MLEDQVLRAQPGLREAEQPVLLFPVVARLFVTHGTRWLAMNVSYWSPGSVGLFGVPGLDRERRLDDREVVLVLRVEPEQRLDSVAKRGAQPWLDREQVQEVVRHARAGLVGARTLSTSAPSPSSGDVTL